MLSVTPSSVVGLFSPSGTYLYPKWQSKLSLEANNLNTTICHRTAHQQSLKLTGNTNMLLVENPTFLGMQTGRAVWRCDIFSKIQSNCTIPSAPTKAAKYPVIQAQTSKNMLLRFYNQKGISDFPKPKQTSRRVSQQVHFWNLVQHQLNKLCLPVCCLDSQET